MAAVNNGFLNKIIFLFSIIIMGLILNQGGVCAENDSQVIAYYFHTNFRCVSCHKIEQYTEDCVTSNFKGELNDGRLVYKVINVEEKENEHFTREYKLYTKSVVLSLVKNGKEIKYKNLDMVWQLLGDKNKFTEYIRAEIQSFLNEDSEGENL